MNWEAVSAAELYRQAAGLDPIFARSQAAVALHLWLDARQAELSEADRRARLDAAAALMQRVLIASPSLAEALMLQRELLGVIIEAEENQSGRVC